MAAVLLSLCCFIGCPALMGVMWLMTRDREGWRLEREVRRLNAEARARREEVAAPAPAGEQAEQPVLAPPAPVARR